MSEWLRMVSVSVAALTAGAGLALAYFETKDDAHQREIRQERALTTRIINHEAMSSHPRQMEVNRSIERRLGRIENKQDQILEILNDRRRR